MPAKPITVHDIHTGATFVLKDSREVAPGVFASAIPPEMLPRRGFCSFVRKPNGDLTPVVKTLNRTIRLTRGIGKQLGIALEEDGSRGAPESVYLAIHRLIKAGFLKAKPLTEGGYRLDLESFWRFWDELDAEFWTDERREKMKAARYDSRP
jgi:hypothetical protein